MKINGALDYKMSVQDELFDNAFFNQFKQSKHAVRLDEENIKEYHFPTFYAGNTVMQAFFLCSYEKACEIMPHSSLKPVKMSLNKSLVIISCYEYLYVKEIKPFNELGMVMPVLLNPKLNIPLLPIIASKLFKNIGYYIFDMPLTSLENKIRGDKIWGLTKHLKEIVYTDIDNFRVCEVFDPRGCPYLTLTVPLSGKMKSLSQSGNIFSIKDKKLLRSQFSMQGNFAINKSFKEKPYDDGSKVLELGSSPSGDILRNLQLETKPFQTRYGVNINSSFSLPDQKF